MSQATMPLAIGTGGASTEGLRYQLTPMEHLLIRSCKVSERSLVRRRLERLYKKYYGVFSLDEKVPPCYIASVMIKLVEKIHPNIPLSEMVNDLHPSRRWNIGCSEHEQDHWEVVIEWCVHKIRWTSAHEIDSFIKSAFWRNQD